MLNVLIVAKKGEMRDGLQALMAARSGLGLVTVTDSLDSAVEFASRNCPPIVMIDAESPRSALRSAVANIKDSCPNTRLLILVDDETSRRTAAAYGADSVLVRGVKADDLAGVVERLVTEFLWQVLLRGL